MRASKYNQNRPDSAPNAKETGLYYLQSRYYNPTWSRFLNADSFVSTGQGMLGNNMFAYCENNPVAYSDYSGCIPHEALGDTVYTLLDCCTGGIVAGAIILIPNILEVVADCTSTAIVEATQATENFVQAVIHEAELLKQQIKSSYQYWEASRINNIIYIGRGLTFTEASFRVSCGLDIMCASESAARWLLIVNGYWNHTDSEIHGSEGYYRHFHPNRYSKTHIWYYM